MVPAEKRRSVPPEGRRRESADAPSWWREVFERDGHISLPLQSRTPWQQAAAVHTQRSSLGSAPLSGNKHFAVCIQRRVNGKMLH